jgi:rhodanese-related sulfurtransferase
MTTKKSSNQATKGISVWVWGLVALVVLAAVAAYAVLPGILQPQSATLPAEISVRQAYQLREQGAFILDVRTQEEWDDTHVPGAVLIPLDELPNRLSEVPPDQQVVVMCRSGNRSKAGREILANAGYEQVTSMAGGINQWTAAGYPTE